MEFDDTRRKLKLITDEEELRSSPDTLNVRQPNSVTEAVDVARKLAFHEQLQLVQLNSPLMSEKLAFPFQPEDIRRADPLECDVLTNTEAVIRPQGSDHAMALIKSTRGVNAEGAILTGKFDSIFMTSEAYQSRGGKIVLVTDRNSVVPDGQVQGKVHIDRKFLDVINAKLAENNRKELPLSLADSRDGADEIVGHDIIPAGPWEDETNEIFYKRFHIGLVLKLSSGKSILLTQNALSEKKEEGSINLVRFTDGKYGIVNTVRMLVGAGATYRPEIGRGYADIAVEKYAKLIKEKYGTQMTPDQLGMELGLFLENALRIETKQLHQDYAYENVTPKLQILDFNKDAVMRTAPNHIQHMLEEFEGLAPIKLTSNEILGLMDTGKMVDGFSMAVFASEFLGKDLVRINPRYLDAEIVLEEKSLIQLGGKNDLVVPQGPAYEAGFKTIGQVHPNTGNARFWYQARFSENVEALPKGPKYVKVPIAEIRQRLIDLKFSTVDAATLFRVLYNQRVFI